MPVGDYLDGLIDVGRPILIVDGNIPKAGILDCIKWNGWSAGVHSSLLPDCDAMQLAASRSCPWDFPIMIDPGIVSRSDPSFLQLALSENFMAETRVR